MRLAALLTAALFLLAVCAGAAQSQAGYVVQFREAGGAWQNAPEQFVWNPGDSYPYWPEKPQFRIYLVRQDANQAREAGKLNHPELEWRVHALG